MDRLSDAGSIPARSMKKTPTKVGVFLWSERESNKEGARSAEGNGSVNHFRRRGLKGARGAGAFVKRTFAIRFATCS